MSTANIFYTLAGAFIATGMVWDTFGKNRLLAPLTFLTGLGFADMSLFFAPGVKGWGLWLPVTFITLSGVMFAVGTALKERKTDGISEVQQGQDDGELPEGPPRHP